VPAGVLLRTECDLIRAESLRPSIGLLSCVRDWLRRWPILASGSASGDETRPDFGRPEDVGPGVVLANGLWRELRRAKGPLGAGALMIGIVKEVRPCVTPMQARRALCAEDQTTKTPEVQEQKAEQDYVQG
jgi:hypothetical protein